MLDKEDLKDLDTQTEIKVPEAFVFLKGNTNTKYQVELPSAMARSLLIKQRFDPMWNPDQHTALELYVPALDSDMELIVSYLQGDGDLSAVRQRLRDYLHLGYQEEAQKREALESRREELQTIFRRLHQTHMEVDCRQIAAQTSLLPSHCLLTFRPLDYKCTTLEEYQFLQDFLTQQVEEELKRHGMEAEIEFKTQLEPEAFDWQQYQIAKRSDPATGGSGGVPVKSQFILLYFRETTLAKWKERQERVQQAKRDAEVRAIEEEMQHLQEVVSERIWSRFLRYCASPLESGRLDHPFQVDLRFLEGNPNTNSNSHSRLDLDAKKRQLVSDVLRARLNEAKLHLPDVQVKYAEETNCILIEHNKCEAFLAFHRMHRRQHLDNCLSELARRACQLLMEELEKKCSSSKTMGEGSNSNNNNNLGRVECMLIPNLWLAHQEVQTLLTQTRVLLLEALAAPTCTLDKTLVSKVQRMCHLFSKFLGHELHIYLRTGDA